MGVNVQKKLVALHHMDVPWRPADMIQREGRILRQGNENKRIFIYRYISDGSFDAYSWQLLESKQRFICQLLSSSITERSASDVDDVVLNYAEIKALAIGNPLIKERVETDNELKRACTLQRKLSEMHIAMKKELFEFPGKVAHIESLIRKTLLDYEHYVASRQDYQEVKKDVKKRREIGATILAALSENVMQSNERKILSYQGFDIILPENMTENKPFVWIKGSGRYYVEIGESDIGCINRIDNKLNSFTELVEKHKQDIHDLSERKSDIETELKKDVSYIPQIEKLREKLKKLDKKLVVCKV
jgi:hypothetical protein